MLFKVTGKDWPDNSSEGVVANGVEHLQGCGRQTKSKACPVSSEFISCHACTCNSTESPTLACEGLSTEVHQRNDYLKVYLYI